MHSSSLEKKGIFGGSWLLLWFTSQDSLKFIHKQLIIKKKEEKSDGRKKSQLLLRKAALRNPYQTG